MMEINMTVYKLMPFRMLLYYLHYNMRNGTICYHLVDINNKYGSAVVLDRILNVVSILKLKQNNMKNKYMLFNLSQKMSVYFCESDILVGGLA